MATSARLTILALLMACSPADATQCWYRPEPAGHQWWTWRLVDGRVCWYMGHVRLARSSLSWPHAEPAPEPIKTVPESHVTTFDERWWR